MLSFPLEIEKNIEAMKISRPLQYRGKPEIAQILDGFPVLVSYGSAFFFRIFSFLVEFHQERGIEWRGILYFTHPVMLLLAFCNAFNTHYLMFAYILLNKYCYSPNDVRGQLIPFSAIPQWWAWKRTILRLLKIHTKLMKLTTKIHFMAVVIRKKKQIYTTPCLH